MSAASSLNRAHQETPDSASALHYLGNALLALGRADEALECAREAHYRLPESEVLQSNLLQTALYAPGQTPASVAELHRQWGENYPTRQRPVPYIRGRRVRIGYVSMNFCVSPDAFFLEPVIQHHDSESFETFLYANVAQEDWRSERFRRFAHHWRPIRGDSAEQTAARIEADEIDLLVECSGHFAESSIRVFCLDPAPVQVSFPIYPASTGLANIHFRISDRVADPPGVTDAWHSETLFRLDDTFACYTPHSDAPPVGELPVDIKGHITFGCFNRLHKVNDSVVRIFSRVLDGVPGSRLLLHHAWAGLNQVPEELAQYVRERFERQGVDGDRIDFAGACALEEHLALYREVDLSLDTFPYAGMTTTCDSLWMGVPVVTARGSAHISRVGVSRLTSLGLLDWIADDPDAYVRVAIEKARAVGELRALRRSLRKRMAESVIVDARLYTRQLEGAYRQMLGL